IIPAGFCLRDLQGMILLSLFQVLKMGPPMLLAREAAWRAYREWKKKRLPGQLERAGDLEFRLVPYYHPIRGTLDKDTRAVICAFADEIVARRLHWLESNPIGIGVNWTLAMEAALRAMSVCFLLNLLSPLRSDEQSWLAAITRSLAQHFLFIEANLEFSHFLTSNHYLSNLV